MAGKALRRWIPVLFLLVVIVLLSWWAQSRRRPPEYAFAYVAEPTSIVWNANAQVRQPVATLHYGDRIAILQRTADRAEVRSDAGVRGWIEASSLMEAEMWQQSAQILARAKAMPVQARGHTRTISNVRLAAGRDGPRIFQFGRNEPVVVLQRTTSPVPQESGAETPAASSAGDNLPKLEDWLLVLRTPPPAPAPGGDAANAAFSGTLAAQSLPGAGAASNAPPAVPIAGWVLARFIDLDPPAPIPDYFSAAGIRVVAWVVLNSVLDDSGPQPQYLVAGARGGEGQPCDFSLLRVYTWGSARHRYETAYVENDICGRLPISVTSSPAGEEFKFADPLQNGADRVYRMRQTSVRRITGAAAAPRSKR